jgi:hypothetical protein
MSDPLRITEYRIVLNRVEQISNLYENESFIADTVLNDWNFDPEFVASCIQRIGERRDEYLKDHRDAKGENIDQIEKFLRGLQAMGEDFLDGLADFVEEWREGKWIL